MLTKGMKAAYKWMTLVATLSLLLSFTVSSGHASAATISTNGEKPPVTASSELQPLLQRLETAGTNAANIWQSFSSKEQEAVFRFLEPDLYQQGKLGELVAITVVPKDLPTLPATKESRGTTPEWCSGHYIRNPRWSWDGYGDGPYVQGYGPGTLTLSRQNQVSNTWSATAGISVSAISASVGFNVTHSSSTTYSYQVNVPRGQWWAIRAHNLYHTATFEIWDDVCRGHDYQVGSGRAYQFYGISYYTWRIG